MTTSAAYIEYHTGRMLSAIEMHEEFKPYDLAARFAEDLAYNHAVYAAHAAHSLDVWREY